MLRLSLDRAFTDLSTVGLSGDRYLTLMTRPVPGLIVFDLLEWRIACAVASPQDGADAVSLTMHADTRHVTQTNRNGQIYVYSCPTSETVLSGSYVDDELVLMDRNGYSAAR